jgi:hypothetical protein
VVDERGRKKVIDGGYTGKITKSTPTPQTSPRKGYVPIVTRLL